MNNITDPFQTTEQVSPESAAAEPTQPAQQPTTSNQRPATATHHHHRPGLLTAIQSLLYLIVIALFIISFSVQPFRIPSGSMEPTLLVGDFLLVDKQGFGFDDSQGIFPAATVHRGDIIIFHYPVDPATHLIKRVVGLPGDHLRLHDNHVYINGQPLNEPYAVYRPSPPDPFRDSFPRFERAIDPDINPAWWIRMHTLMDHGELIIPAGDYFVLGDNRNGSDDSRYWGFVPRSNIVGKPLFIYPPRRLTDTDSNEETPPNAPKSILHFARWHRIFTIVH
jgi:signal peptidase I